MQTRNRQASNETPASTPLACGTVSESFTGEWPKVTLTPSIGIRYDGQGNAPVSGYHWHGYLENGVFVER